MLTGVRINDSNMICLHNDINNQYKQYYTENTNILNTEIFNSYFKLNVIQKDFMPINKNVLIRRYEFQNKNSIDLNIDFLIYSKLITDINNQVSGLCKNNILKQYMHDYTFCIFSKNEINSYQINSTENNIDSGVIGGKDYVGMSPDSSISYNLKALKPGDSVIIYIYIYVKENSFRNTFEKIDQDIEYILKNDPKKELDDTKRYWEKYYKAHDVLKIDSLDSNIDNNSTMNENGDILPSLNKNGVKFKEPVLRNLKKIYERTILLFPLLINERTGGISAGIEIDEEKLSCGRYSYCWPRDAIFITEAMDTLNMKKESDKFYNAFCRNTQSKNGMWEQRFYTDGNLAPCWGYQVDETAAVIYGVYNHYLNIKDDQFLKNTLRMCENALEFLLQYVEKDLNLPRISEDVVKNEIINEKLVKKLNSTETTKVETSEIEESHLSYDLWEEREGIHTYSVAAIYSSFIAMQKIYEIVLPLFEKNRLKQEKIRAQNLELEKKVLEIKEYILKNFYNIEKKSFVRNNLDFKMDISLLGLVTPFEVFTPEDKKIKNTVDKLNLTIRTYTGGYLRYEGDTYSGGNPWVIANLWMAEYHIKDNNIEEAKKCFEFVVRTCSEHGYLGEQVNNLTMKPSWVIGLGWSHAMFINLLKKLI